MLPRIVIIALLFGAALPLLARTTADHSKFEELQRPFQTGPEVTAACLQCHTEAATQLHQTSHWTWAFDNPVTGQALGKKNVINNFCVATATNWPRCTSCHIGYGWKDESFDLSSEQRVDCLVCHDTTGEYKKFPTGAGHPNYTPMEWPPKSGKIRQPPDLAKIAQRVGQPNRSNCGSCHFYGGGGDGVKHGHLDSSLHHPNRQTDIHMDEAGLNFKCQTCHTTGGHEIAGSRYVTKAADSRGQVRPGDEDQVLASCESCHSSEPHEAASAEQLNQHTDRVACVTCHIPRYARGGKKTKMWWDWSSAGRKGEDGKPLMIKDSEGYATYDFKKGEFVWEENVTPEYYWFDGDIRYTLLGETIDPEGVVPINRIQGSYRDPNSRIWPFKVMRGKQPYDAKQNILAIPHLFGKDESAYWKNFDWDRALQAGLLARGQVYSGEYGFVETEYFWPVTHMVATKEEALSCDSCHRQNGRLQSVGGFYLPGRDRNETLDFIGWLMVFGTLGGVTLHGIGRLVARRRGGR
ncbi:tetrathionate reductase family octaheme c-type cytochrome [Ectothiorhodospiraceae bacterium BW-2]|nr:tetrathionate reductase family octaheme c-type cytochrome [Ectothiorhodospiraceae bacterium BW-2]QEP42875.1 tetrathionate reductase family octaheme c-type cytochrome [Ectothiorhodospiraceae bacterium BW-2]